jgi:hypothetical protein
MELCEPERATLRDALRPLINADPAELQAVGAQGAAAAMRGGRWSDCAARYAEVYSHAASTPAHARASHV